MGRKIVLYRNCRILEDKNMQVDSLKDYLNTLQTKVYPNAVQTAEPQIIKNINDIDLTIKVDIDQEDYLKRSVHNQYNYAMITIDDNSASTNAYYYFIRKINWRSGKCAELELHMDILNTYHGEYTLTDKTAIERMHKNRFSAKYARSWNKIGDLDDSDWNWGSGSPGELIGRATFTLTDIFKGEDIDKSDVRFDYDQSPYPTTLWEFERDVSANTITITMYIQSESIPQEPYGIFMSYKRVSRNIDYVDEGIQPVLVKKCEETIYDKSNMRWYTFYTGSYDLEAETPIVTYLQAENACKVTHKQSEGGLISVSQISDTDKYYELDASKTLSSGESKRVFASADGTNWRAVGTFGYKTGSILKDDDYQDIIQLKKSGTDLLLVKARKYFVFTTKGYRARYSISQEINVGAYVRIEDETYIGYHLSNSSVTSDNFDTIVASSTQHFTLTEPVIETVTLNGVNTINRTNSKLIKMVELPYAPANITLNNNGDYTLNNNETATWYYTDTDIDFPKSFKLNTTGVADALTGTIESPVNPLLELFTNANVNLTSARNDTLESKLYNSNYHYYKFVYDSFNYNVPLECINEYKVNNFNITFTVSNNTNGKFMFTFDDIAYKFSTQDYDKILMVNRNNEIPLASSAYLNYMRNSYNYDVKAKNLGIVQSFMNMGNSIAQGAVSGALSGGSSGGGGGAIAGAALGAAGGIANTLINTVRTNDSFNQKIYELQHQAVSVSGGDDIDLLRSYSDGNKMKVCLYEVSDNTKERIADLFYYCGYKCGYQAVPVTNSRCWFNFIQCNPVYDTDSTHAKLSKECLDELTRKYQSGVTVYHMNTISGTKTWDLEQSKENWETWLLN